MNNFNFRAGGSLPANSPVYIVRKADEQASFHLSHMEYISIIEPRQHGKTSLINHLINAFKSFGYVFVVCEIPSTISSSITAKDWYHSLCNDMLPQLNPVIARSQQPVLPESSTSWYEFLSMIAERASATGQRMVIVLDEASRVPPSLATDFFAAIRSIFTSRLNFSFLECLTFIIAGAFNPKELIQDPALSSFNIDQRIHLEDFDLSQVKQLVAHLNLPEVTTEAVSNRIYYWTSGQPYLSQELCHTLTEHRGLAQYPDLDRLVDGAVTRFLSHESNYMDRFKRLLAEPELLEFARSIATGSKPPRLIAGIDNRHFRLAHVLGIIKADSNGFCQIRNRICEQVLAEIEASSNSLQLLVTKPLSIPSNQKQAATTQPLGVFSYDVFISYSHEDKDDVRSILLSKFESEGVHFYIDEVNFDLGAPLLSNITKAMNRCRKILLVLSPNSISSDWVMYESNLVLTNDPTNRNQRLIPIVLKPCVLPEELQHLTCLDLTEPREFENRLQRLISSLKSDQQKD